VYGNVVFTQLIRKLDAGKERRGCSSVVYHLSTSLRMLVVEQSGRPGKGIVYRHCSIFVNTLLLYYLGLIGEGKRKYGRYGTRKLFGWL
jgi:hypothetical protein